MGHTSVADSFAPLLLLGWNGRLSNPTLERPIRNMASKLMSAELMHPWERMDLAKACSELDSPDLKLLCQC